MGSRAKEIFYLSVAKLFFSFYRVPKDYVKNAISKPNKVLPSRIAFINSNLEPKTNVSQ
jgi:hypothetical protein